MHSGDIGLAGPAEHREGPVIHVEMEHVEIVHALAHPLHEQHVRRDRVADRRIEAERARPDRVELGARDAVAAGEQGHVVSESHQFFGKERDNALGSAIQLGRDGLVKWGDLGDTHWRRFPPCRT